MDIWKGEHLCVAGWWGRGLKTEGFTPRHIVERGLLEAKLHQGKQAVCRFRAESSPRHDPLPGSRQQALTPRVQLPPASYRLYWGTG